MNTKTKVVLSAIAAIALSGVAFASVALSRTGGNQNQTFPPFYSRISAVWVHVPVPLANVTEVNTTVLRAGLEAQGFTVRSADVSYPNPKLDVYWKNGSVEVEVFIIGNRTTGGASLNVGYSLVRVDVSKPENSEYLYRSETRRFGEVVARLADIPVDWGTATWSVQYSD